MKKKIKVIFILPTLRPGGAERIMSFISQNLSNSDFQSDLWILGTKSDIDYKIDGDFVKYFNKSRVLYSFFPLIRKLKKEKPDIVISSISHLNIFMGYISIFFPKTKFVGREANVPSVQKKVNTGSTSSISILKLSYFFLDSIICQSLDMMDDLKNMRYINQNKLVLINNPITDGFTPKRQSKKIKGQVKLITVGRLKKQKGHLRIVKAISKLNFDFIYTIIGDGPEKERIFSLIKEKNLEGKIIHIPFTKNVSEYLCENDIFLQGSYVEGFPNSLLESCSVGLPIVAFNAPGGLNEIIENGLNGFICNHQEEFVSKIKNAVNRHWNVEHIVENIHSKFGKDKIILEYESLFKKLVT